MQAGLEKENAAVLVVLAGLRDGTTLLLALERGHRESPESWAAMLRDLTRRGLTVPTRLSADGHLGIWAARAPGFPETAEQRCWTHRSVNGLDKVRKKARAQATLLLTTSPYAETREAAPRLKGTCQAWCQQKGVRDAARLLDEDWERMLTVSSVPKEHGKPLRTTTPVASPFAAVRLRTTAAKRSKRGENATAVIWKTLMVAEKSVRRLDHPELLAEVAEGATYVTGLRVKRSAGEAAA